MEDLFAAMNEAVKGKSGELLQQKFKGSVVFHVGKETYSLDMKAKSCSVEKGRDTLKSPDLIVTVNPDVLRKLISGNIKPQQAFMRGKLKVKGKMNLAMKLPILLSATRKKIQNSKL